jgi:hypothetical protein
MAVRNASQSAVNASAALMEVGFQFVNNQVLTIGNRTLTGNATETGSFNRLYIDDLLTIQLVVLDLFAIGGSSNYEVVQYQYGNFDSLKNLNALTSTLFATLTFATTAGSRVLFDANNLLMLREVDGGNSTDVTLFFLDNTTTTHTNSSAVLTTAAVGTAKYFSRNCILFNSASSYILYKYQTASNSFTQSSDVSTLLTAQNLTGSENIYISSTCDRLRVGATVYTKASTNAAFA